MSISEEYYAVLLARILKAADFQNQKWIIFIKWLQIFATITLSNILIFKLFKFRKLLKLKADKVSGDKLTRSKFLLLYN